MAQYTNLNGLIEDRDTKIDEGCKLGSFPMKSPILYTGDFIPGGHDQSGAF